MPEILKGVLKHLALNFFIYFLFLCLHHQIILNLLDLVIEFADLMGHCLHFFLEIRLPFITVLPHH